MDQEKGWFFCIIFVIFFCNCLFLRLITNHDNVVLQFTTARIITNYDNRLLQFTIGTLYYNSRPVLQFTTSVITINSRQVLQFTTEQTWPWVGSEAGGDLVLIQTSLLFICRSYNASFCFCFREKRALKRWQSSQKLSQYWPKEERDLKSDLVRSVRFVFASLNVPLNPASFFICTLVHCALINSSWDTRLTEKRSGITKIINN